MKKIKVKTTFRLKVESIKAGGARGLDQQGRAVKSHSRWPGRPAGKKLQLVSFV